MRFDVVADQGSIRAVEQMLRDIPGAVERAASRALNRTGTTTRKFIVDETSERSGFKKSTVRRATKLHRANRKKLVATLVIRGRRVPLIELGARQTSKGVTFTKGGERKLLRSGFIARARGKRKVFLRRPMGGKLAPRNPIDEQFGPSITGAFRREVLEDANEQAIETLGVQLRTQGRVELERIQKRAAAKARR